MYSMQWDGYCNCCVHIYLQVFKYHISFVLSVMLRIKLILCIKMQKADDKKANQKCLTNNN